jgi:hypothetical protein
MDAEVLADGPSGVALDWLEDADVPEGALGLVIWSKS